MTGLNPFESLLVKVTNTSAEDVARIQPGETRTIFRSPSWFLSNPGIESGIVAGKLKMYDLAGKQIPAHPALAGITGLKKAAADLSLALSLSPGDLSSYAAKVSWNVVSYSHLIAIIRADTLASDLGGVTPEAILASLAPSAALASLGMFLEAAAAVRVVPADAFLTSERLALYVDILESANAIV